MNFDPAKSMLMLLQLTLVAAVHTAKVVRLSSPALIIPSNVQFPAIASTVVAALIASFVVGAIALWYYLLVKPNKVKTVDEEKSGVSSAAVVTFRKKLFELFAKGQDEIGRTGARSLLQNEAFMFEIREFLKANGVDTPKKIPVGFKFEEDKEGCKDMQRMLLRAQRLCQSDSNLVELHRLFHVLRNEVVRSNYAVYSDHRDTCVSLKSRGGQVLQIVYLNMLATVWATGHEIEEGDNQGKCHQNLSGITALQDPAALARDRAQAILDKYMAYDVVFFQEADPELAELFVRNGFDVAFDANTQLAEANSSNDFISAKDQGTHKYGQMVATRLDSCVQLVESDACMHAGSGSISQFGRVQIRTQTKNGESICEDLYFMHIHWTLFQNVGVPAEYAQGLYDRIRETYPSFDTQCQMLIVGDSNATLDVDVPKLNTAYQALDCVAKLFGCLLAPTTGMFTTFSYGMRGLTLDHIFVSDGIQVTHDSAEKCAMAASDDDIEQMLGYDDSIGLLGAGRKHTVNGMTANTTYMLMYWVACDFFYGKAFTRHINKESRVLRIPTNAEDVAYTDMSNLKRFMCKQLESHGVHLVKDQKAADTLRRANPNFVQYRSPFFSEFRIFVHLRFSGAMVLPITLLIQLWLGVAASFVFDLKIHSLDPTMFNLAAVSAMLGASTFVLAWLLSPETINDDRKNVIYLYDDVRGLCRWTAMLNVETDKCIELNACVRVEDAFVQLPNNKGPYDAGMLTDPEFLIPWCDPREAQSELWLYVSLFELPNGRIVVSNAYPGSRQQPGGAFQTPNKILCQLLDDPTNDGKKLIEEVKKFREQNNDTVQALVWNNIHFGIKGDTVPYVDFLTAIHTDTRHIKTNSGKSNSADEIVKSPGAVRSLLNKKLVLPPRRKPGDNEFRAIARELQITILDHAMRHPETVHDPDVAQALIEYCRVMKAWGMSKNS